jgi:predicted dinucleotide-binding enzyme
VVPTKHLAEALVPLEGYSGIVVNLSVSANVGRDGAESTAERVARELPQAKVVSAFTSVWSEVVRNPGIGEKTSVFVCSDHPDAKDVVSELVREVGFEAVNGGGLASALYAEVMGMFAVRLALDCGYGKTITFHAFKAR